MAPCSLVSGNAWKAVWGEMKRKETVIVDTFDPENPPWVVNPPPDNSTPESDAYAREAVQQVMDRSFTAQQERMKLLSHLIHERNVVDTQIAELIGRPALAGHIGEYIAAEIFGIALEASASAAAIDGMFATGPLAGRSVNVKLYGKREGMLDLPAEGGLSADYTLVLTGPTSSAGSSRGIPRPIVISAVYLFQNEELVAAVRARGAKIGVATSVAKAFWEAAEIYPRGSGTRMVLDEGQRMLLGLFGAEDLLP